MLFYQSPDERWVVIISDVHLTRTDVWLYDSDTTAAPVRVDAKRSGRHVGSEWHGSSVFEIYRAGMGNRISELFRVDDVARKRVIHDILLYEAEKDIYVRYFFDDGYKSWVALGRAFSTDRKEEKYPIELDIDYLSDAVFAIEEVKIDGSSLFVTHKKKDGTLVQETFPSDTLKGVR
jgi:hypothetical protein